MHDPSDSSCPSDAVTQSRSSGCEGQVCNDGGCPLFSAQIARKRAEQDSILLANRIRLLRKEEERTRKKTVETEQKTHELLEVRRRNEERRALREAEQAHREAEEREIRAQMNQMRDQHTRKLEEKQRVIMSKITDSSKAVRHDRELHNKHIQQEREEALAELAAKTEKVRKMQLAAARSRARSEAAKKDLAKSGVEDRIDREEQLRMERFKEIEKMEREEATLLSKLQMSQERHRAAFLQLEDALKQTDAGCQPPSATQLRPPSSRSSSASTPSGTGSSLRANVLDSGAARAAAALAATGAAAAASVSASARGSISRPPRPRGPAAVTHHPPAVPASAGATSGRASSLSALGAVSSSAGPRRQPPRRSATCETGLSTSTNETKREQQPVPEKAMSSCSTASGGTVSRQSGGGSGRSTPSSPSPANRAITYTTVDGMELNIPTEEDLDLASLLNC